MKIAFAFASMFFAASAAFATQVPATSELPNPVKPVAIVDFAPFGVTQDSDLAMIGCEVYQEDLYDCKGFPEKNAMFTHYTVETRSGPKDGICHVTAYTQVFRGDRTGYHVINAYNTLGSLLERKYGQPTKVIQGATREYVGFDRPEHFAAAVSAGVQAYSLEWSNKAGKLPEGTSVKMTMVALSEEKTFVELNYFFGGPDCVEGIDEALRGL